MSITSRVPFPPGTLTPTYARRPSGDSAIPMPPPRYSPVVTGPVAVRYGTRARRVRAAVSTTATPSAVATQARPSAPTASPYGAVPTRTEATGPRAGSTKVTVSAPKSATSSVPAGAGAPGDAADGEGADGEGTEGEGAEGEAAPGDGDAVAGPAAARSPPWAQPASRATAAASPARAR